MYVPFAEAPFAQDQIFNRPQANASTLKTVFQTLQENSCPLHYNFHMHTVYSDGQLLPSEIMQQAVDIGLQGLAITDHHTTGGYRAAQRWLQEQRQTQAAKHHHGDGQSNLPLLWSGIEINAGLLGTEVHILGYGFDPDHRALQPYQQGEAVTGSAYQADRVVAAIHTAGGLAVLAHPARYRGASVEALIPEAYRLGFDGVEAYYAYGNPSPWKPTPKPTHQVKQLSRRYGLFNTCGTDTHGTNILQRL
ncbi:PHP domain-containing protein [Geitlerinema sp. PCC 9228]|jgi:hypothetical protein|uniref:PHP domain-containing protein n=1 Tax=Geitlerinema sp. PCC 9228 TaxID=111611 RepID=UPI0008F9C57B|nr:PHP domain-containing protein [Geitlerinema sp. PCC 9228]